MEKLLTLKEVCNILGCNDPKGRYVRNLRDKGVLECAKFGRHLMFTESSVERFIKEQFDKQNPKTKKRRMNASGDEVPTQKNFISIIAEKERLNG